MLIQKAGDCYRYDKKLNTSNISNHSSIYILNLPDQMIHFNSVELQLQRTCLTGAETLFGV